MKVTVLEENTTCRDDLRAEHGLSLYIESGPYKVLFDMGQSDAFACNAKVLGIDLAQVDFAVLSHGHYDHGGGLRTFLTINNKAPVYVHKNAFGNHYNGTEKYIGLDETLRNEPRLVFTEGIQELTPDITLLDCGEEKWHFDTCGLYEKSGEVFQPDSFCHEQYLLIKDAERKILFSGCSHRGIRNIARYFCSDIFFGGLHLNKVDNPVLLEQIARELLTFRTSYYTGHCTGKGQFDRMKPIMDTHLQPLSTGMEIEV